MKLFELRDLVSARTRDTVAPYFATDEEIDANLNEAQREACVRALLIEDEITLDINTTDTKYALDPRVIDVIGIEDFYEDWTLTEQYLVLDKVPSSEISLTLHVYRLPSSNMESDDDEPEIRPVYHTQMADWAIYLHYMTPDADMFDGNAAERYLARFVQSFGDRPNALTHRNRRSKTSRCIINNGYI